MEQRRRACSSPQTREALWPAFADRAQGLLPRELEIGEPAEAHWRDFYNWIEERFGACGDLRPVRDFAAKAAEHAARIPGVLAITVRHEHPMPRTSAQPQNFPVPIDSALAPIVTAVAALVTDVAEAPAAPARD